MEGPVEFVCMAQTRNDANHTVVKQHYEQQQTPDMFQ